MMHVQAEQEDETLLSTSEDVVRIHTTLDAFDPHVPAQVSNLVRILDQSSTLLAGSQHARRNIGNATSPSIWPALRHLWAKTLSAHMVPDQDPELAAHLKLLSTSTARFTRNLVAAVPSNQRQAFANEIFMRNLVFHYTSYTAIHDHQSYPVTRMLTQALSNLVTENDVLAETLWSMYLNLPEEQNILTRLFASPDARTVSSAFVLVLNCIHGSAQRAELLADSPRGPRTCISLLDRMASLFDTEDTSEDSRAFDIGYEIGSRLIDAGLVGKLYERLAVEDEAISPHQTTLLKILDSYLHTSNRACEVALSRQRGVGDGCLCHTLTRNFLDFATYVQCSLQRTSGFQGWTSPDVPEDVPASVECPYLPISDGMTEMVSMDSPRVSSQGKGIPPLHELDLLLPKVCEALVLVTQCLTTITLRAEETGQTLPMSSQTNPRPAMRLPRTILVNASTSEGQGSIECLIETLRLVDAFVPRITYGKVFQRPAASAPREDQGKVYPDANTSGLALIGEGENERGETTSSVQGQGPQNVQAAAQAFGHVKRDLVRLLGILASHDRAVQDRVRGCGGIPVVMNLCVVDDYNPYLREHAIFALRNLLDGNLENQAVVDAIKPFGRWDEDKVLQGFRGA